MANFIDLEDNRFFASYATFTGCANNLHDALGLERPEPGSLNRACVELASTGKTLVAETSYGTLYIGKVGSTFYPFFQEK